MKSSAISYRDAVQSDRDMWADANALIERHGETAWFEASTKADAHFGRGDVAGERYWIRVLCAVTWLQDRRGRDPFKVEH